MTRCCFLKSAFAVAIALIGCGPSELPYNDNSQDAGAYARDIKTMVATAVRQAKGSNEPLDYLTPVLHELQRTDRPLGELGPIYADLRVRVEQLVRDCQTAGGKAPNLSGRLDELIKLTQALPGEAPATENRN